MEQVGQNDNSPFEVRNYAVAFLDLLGQQDIFAGCGLLPKFNNTKEQDDFISVLKKSIGAVHDLQTSCEEMFNNYCNQGNSRKSEIPKEKHELYDTIKKVNIKTQRWSDGFVAYNSLGDPEIPVPINGLFGLLATCGTMCLTGLGKKNPIRGGLDVAWGVELRNNELYGCVVSRAYNLESRIAQYPRIVVGENLSGYLLACSNDDGKDEYAQFNRKLAVVCMELLDKDSDGAMIINYLGRGF